MDRRCQVPMSDPGSGATGRLAFLFSDIVDSTANWERYGDAMAASLRVHDAVMRACIQRHRGVIFSNPGDGFGVAFQRDDDAVHAALESQAALAVADWGVGPSLSVRIGVHAGTAEFRDDNYFGPPVNQAARVCDAGHGGQVLLDPTVRTDGRVATRALGEYLLKGVSQPTALFQVGEGEFGPLRALDIRRSNLGAAPNELVGRDEQQSDLVDLLTQQRLVTVTGVGGVGKTRLTHAVGADAVPRFEDGVWFAELAPCRDLRSVLSTAAAALGVPVPEDARRLAELVRGHDLLLILDNCEHVLGDVAELCTQFLAETTRLRILTSSREQIGVAGEHIYPLAPFSSTEPAAQIFRQRATAAGVDVEGIEPEIEHQICEQLDRIPLAIELAAATCRVLSPVQILERLDKRFELLRGARRSDAHSRHETLRNAIDWSYESLDPTQQTFLRRVAFFNGGFGVEGAEHIAADLDRPALFLLSELVDRSLITVTAQVPEARYDLLETIRIYARDRSVELGESDLSIDRHVDWCRAHIDENVRRAFGPEEPAAIARLVAETANYRAAIGRLLRRADGRAAADLAVALDDITYAANPLAELVGPIVSSGAVEHHPERHRLLGIELIRRSTVEGTEGRAELAGLLVELLSAGEPGTVQLPVLLIASALRQRAGADALRKLRDHARQVTDPAERARLLVAGLLGTFFSDDLPKPQDQVIEAIDAATAAGMKRLLIPIGAAVCIGGLSTGEVEQAVATARPILDLLDDLPTPSIMASGLVVTYTEAAVRAGAANDDQMAAVRRLGPVLQGDFNRLGLALARLAQRQGEHDLAVQAVAACSREGRSGFSTQQIDAILDSARVELGSTTVDAIVAEGGRKERSEIYRELWSLLQPFFAEANRLQSTPILRGS
jgi:predicted ATPase/class 3 adenylate cyclase